MGSREDGGCRVSTICSECKGALVKEGYVQVATRCGHVFHKDCLGKWYGSQGRYSCPVCGDTTESDLTQPLFPTMKRDYEFLAMLERAGKEKDEQHARTIATLRQEHAATVDRLRFDHHLQIQRLRREFGGVQVKTEASDLPPFFHSTFDDAPSSPESSGQSEASIVLLEDDDDEIPRKRKPTNVNSRQESSSSSPNSTEKKLNKRARNEMRCSMCNYKYASFDEYQKHENGKVHLGRPYHEC